MTETTITEKKKEKPIKWREMAFEERPVLAAGHRLCAGCAAPLVVKFTMMATEDPSICVSSTGCLEVSTTIYPYTAWQTPWVHCAFENAAAVASGIEAGLKALMRKNKIPKRKTNVIAFSGDGGTYDIGVQALSGALERGHNLTYVCYDNSAYENTGIQRSGATPYGAATTTSPGGKVIPGKPEFPKDIVKIAAAHDVQYVATVNVAYPKDFIKKIRKALASDDASFIHAFSPCPLGWRADSSLTIRIAELAVETCMYPLYEVDCGEYRLTKMIKKENKVPVEEFLKTQGRFRHLFKPKRRDDIINDTQKWVDWKWQQLLRLCGVKEE